MTTTSDAWPRRPAAPRPPPACDPAPDGALPRQAENGVHERGSAGAPGQARAAHLRWHAEPQRRIRVMVVDEHPMFRTGLAHTLREDGRFDVVAEAGDGDHAVALFHALRPALVLMDMALAGLDGLQAARAMRSLAPQVRILILGALGGDERIRRAFEAGAAGYLLKSAEKDAIVAGALAVAAGLRHAPPGAGAWQPGVRGGNALTACERKVLGLLCIGHSNKQIARALDIAEGTVKYHLVHVFSKMGVSRRCEAVHAAVARGFVDVPGGAALEPR